MQNITVEELKSRMDAGEKLNIIDVREPHEYAEFNIGGKLTIRVTAIGAHATVNGLGMRR